MCVCVDKTFEIIMLTFTVCYTRITVIVHFPSPDFSRNSVNGVSDPDKYSSTGQYYLSVNDLTSTDGGVYGCELVGVGGQSYPAHIAVIGECHNCLFLNNKYANHMINTTYTIWETVLSLIHVLH